MARHLSWIRKDEFQITILGNSGVGKSSLLRHFVLERAPTLFEPKVTTGAEFRVKSIRLPDGVVRLKIWDTSGQHCYKELLRTYYTNSLGVVIVYDIRDRNSFMEAQSWVSELRESLSPELVIAFAGSKADMEIEREVTMSEAEEYAQHNKLIFMETSAVSGLNVTNCFEEMAKVLSAQQNQQKLLAMNKKKEQRKSGLLCCLFKSNRNVAKSSEISNL